MIKKWMAAATVLCIAAALFFCVTAAPAEFAPDSADTEAASLSGTGYDYSRYLMEHGEKSRPDTKATADLSGVQPGNASGISVLKSFENRENVIKWASQTGTGDFAVEVPASGLYNIQLTYMPILETNRSMELSLLIDGVSPYQNAKSLTFSFIYRNESKKQDRLGNDILSLQIKQPVWTTSPCTDPDGLHDDPLLFYFEQGRHIITLDVSMGAFYLAEILLYNTSSLPTYEQKLAQWREAGAKEATGYETYLEGEDALDKSAPTIIPFADSGDAAMRPHSASVRKLNAISSSAPGEWMTWQFDVPESGLYRIDMRYRQDVLRGFFVTRRIYVNGEIPFAEFADARFMFGSRWQYESLGGQPYLVYLEKGPCEIKTEVILGAFSEIIRELSLVEKDMRLLYRKIIMITSTSPDVNRDYSLEKQVEDFDELLTGMSEKLNRYGKELESLSGSRGGSEAAFLFEIADQLDSLRKRPETVKTRLDRYVSNMSGLSAWILAKKTQPLAIDYLRVVSPEQSAERASAGFFEGFWFRVKALVYSFMTDYSSVGDIGSESKALTVWINTGIDQAGVLKGAIDDLFVHETNIPINLKLVQGSLIEAALAGQGPDIALMLDRSSFINLAARGIFKPLSSRQGFDETIKAFLPETMVPYDYEGECYALPVTQTFNMMFYRSDIFQELSLKPPQTWQEMSEVISILQSHNMQVAMGTPPSSIDMPVADIFATLMLQKGITYYNDDLTATNFEKPEAVEAFQQWTRFFTQSTLPESFDFYNRFRTGEMPLGIQPISQYNMLAVAAPEIKNLWEMVPIPGTKQPDGTINRAQIADGSCCAILNTNANEEDSWKFIQWWVSVEAQEQYGRQTEMFLGVAARWVTANLDAFRKMPWSEKELNNLYSQWEEVREIPSIPAGYYTTRGIANAFRGVLYRHENPREALFYQNRLINKEIERKREEIKLNMRSK